MASITITSPNLTQTELATLSPFEGVSVFDATGTTIDTLTITVSGLGGTFSPEGTNPVQVGPGSVYTLTGTAASITAQLLGLDFTPATIQPGTGTTTSFAFSFTSPETGTPATGQMTIAYPSQNIFELNQPAGAGNLSNVYVWSDPANWSYDVVPSNGDSVYQGMIGYNQEDDLSGLSLANLNLFGGITVTGSSLTVGDVTG